MARLREGPVDRNRPFTVLVAWVFTGASLLVAGALCAVLPWLTHFVSAGEISLGPMLIGSFVAFVAVQAAKYPLGMYMTDARGLRFQVPPSLCSCRSTSRSAGG